MMKILGRTFVILAVFAIFSGLMVTVVNATGANAPDFDGAPQFRPDGDNGGFRPEGGENRRERGEGGLNGPRWMFGLIKNVGVMAVLVTIIVWPKSITKKKRKQGATSA
jgi:hypothetical protein